MPNVDAYQHFTKQVFLDAADTTKEVQAAPGVNKALHVQKVTATIITSAAQAVDIESGDGTVEVLKIPLSAAVGAQFHVDTREGIKLPNNTSLRVQPAAAGPAIHVVTEGYTLGAF